MSLTSFIAEFRDYYDADPYTEELGDQLIGACAKQAVRKINKYSPRANQREAISIEDGATYVLLPTNFQSANLPSLYKLKTGLTLEDPNGGFADISLGSGGQTIYYFPVSNGRFRADGKVYARRGNDDQEQVSIEIFQTESGRWALWLDTDSASARTERNWSYTAAHELTDTVGEVTAKDTISGDLRDVLIDVTMQISLLTQARQLRREGKNSEADGYEKQAKSYGASLGTIAPLGGAA